MSEFSLLDTPRREPSTSGGPLRAADRAALAGLEASLVDARRLGDTRPSFSLIAASLADLGVPIPAPRPHGRALSEHRDAWLARLRSAGRSESTVRAYRNAIDDVAAWNASREDADAFAEAGIVDYFSDYRRRAAPAPATYHRRFLLLRTYMRWLSSRHGTPDPFVDLEAPPKPRQEADWLTPPEFRRLLEAAGRPLRRRAGLVARDRLVLLALVTTGLRRSELVSLDWRDIDLESDRPSLLVRRGKGGTPRRQPLAPPLARALRALACERAPRPNDPVFCGLAGKRLQPTMLAEIIRRAARRAGLEKHVTAHTLRHTAATWLRQETGDARLVAEYLGHADLSTVSRYAHIAPEDLHQGAAALAARIDDVWTSSAA
jgi:integrase/recombinase XerC